ncbi:MAG: hypothetical protein WA461_12440 [Nitrososphaeraceae archaeon]
MSSPPFLVRESHMRTNITLGPKGFDKTLKCFQRSRGGLVNTAWSTIEDPCLLDTEIQAINTPKFGALVD